LTLIQVLNQLTEEWARRVGRIKLVANLVDALALAMLNVSGSVWDEECTGHRRLFRATLLTSDASDQDKKLGDKQSPESGWKSRHHGIR
jgi:hypothetical protein